MKFFLFQPVFWGICASIFLVSPVGAQSSNNTAIDVGTLRNTITKADGHLEEIRHQYFLYSEDKDQKQNKQRFDTQKTHNELQALKDTLKKIPPEAETLRNRLGQTKPYAIPILNNVLFEHRELTTQVEDLEKKLDAVDMAINALAYGQGSGPPHSSTTIYDDKTNQYYTAEKDLQDAQKELDLAHDELRIAEDEFDDAQRKVDNINDDIDDQYDEIADQRDRIEFLKNSNNVPAREIAAAEAQLQNLESQLPVLAQQLNQAEAERDTKEQLLDDAQKNVADKTAIRDDKQAILDRSQKEREDALDEYTDDFGSYNEALEAYRHSINETIIQMDELKFDFNTLEQIIRSFRTPPVLKGGILPGPKESDMQEDPKTGVSYIAENFIPALANWLMVALMGVSVIMLIVSGLFFLFSEKEETKEKAKDTLIFVFVGLAIAVLSFTIVRLIVGFDFTIPF